jgi:CheY-like chemotaxis protein
VPAQIPPSGIRERATRVLVVDDDFDSAEVLGVILAAKGYDVRVGLSAKEALAIVEDFTPHVALIDIGLPSTTGYELLAALRANAALGACRYVAVTGYDGKDLAQRSIRAGFHEHLVKPVAIPTLLAAIASSNLSDAESG